MIPERDKIRESIEAERYEEAFGVTPDATSVEINRAHIKSLRLFSEDSETMIALNRAKGLIARESKTDKSRRFYRIGKQFCEAGSQQEALPYLGLAIELYPDPLDYHWMGTALVQLGREEEAVPYLITATALNPNAINHWWLSNTLINLKRYEDAVPYLYELVKIKPTAENVFLLGRTLSQLNREEEALPYLKKAVELRASATDYSWLGASLVVLRRYDEALPHLIKAVDMRGNESDLGWLRRCQDALGFSERDAGHSAIPFREFEESITTNPTEAQSKSSSYRFRLSRETEDPDDIGWTEGRSCGDGECIGIINSAGRCTKCGKTYGEGIESEKSKTERRMQRRQEDKLSARRKKKTIYISIAIVLIILSIVILINSQSPSDSGPGSSDHTTNASPKFPGNVGQPSPYSGVASGTVGPFEPYRVDSTPPFPEQPLPVTGSIRKHIAAKSIAPFQIKAAEGTHCLVKLLNAENGSPVLTVFVRSGTTVDAKVPLGSYEVRFAFGKRWYGYEHLFGSDTAYSKAEKTFTFEDTGERLRGHTITLYKVTNGNLHVRDIAPEEF